MQRPSAILIIFCLATILAVFGLLDPIAQDLSYHRFADQRFAYGIPRFHDPISNPAFLASGLFGLLTLARLPKGIARCRAPWWPAALCFFIAMMLIGLSSAYYHLEPNNDRMLWDRISITLGIMSLLAAFIADRLNISTGLRFYLPLLLLSGTASVVYWWWTETAQQGDLRAYALVQFLPIIIMVLLCAAYPPGTWLSGRKLSLIIFFYALAKFCESNDLLIYLADGKTISGHTLKHYFAALASTVPAVHLLQLRQRPGQFLVRG